jgi:RNA recognition motif-containing protein
MKLFIANLPHKLEETELKKMLTQFGQVASVKLVTDADTGKRKGFGFVEMPVYDQAKAAIAGLNEKEIYGRKIALSEAEEKGRESSVGNNQRPRREYRSYGNDQQGEIDGNKW